MGQAAVMAWQLAHGGEAFGTFGSVNVSAAFVALTVLVLPWPVWLLAGAVLGWAHALTALAALLVAGAARARRWEVMVASIPTLAAVLWIAFLLMHKTQSLGARWALWTIGVADWWSTWTSVVFGWGLGGWATRFRYVYLRGETVPSTVASNDYVQWLHETGLLGVVVLAVAVWWAAPSIWGSRHYAPACVALAVLAAGSFPFHHAVLQAVSVTLLACAWREGRAC